MPLHNSVSDPWYNAFKLLSKNNNNVEAKESAEDSAVLKSRAPRSDAEILQDWDKFIAKLEKIEKEVAEKTRKKVELHNRMPTQTELRALKEECLRLTEEYYGSGKSNLSLFYHFFMSLCEKSETIFFTYEGLYKEFSADGFVRAIDEKQIAERGAAYGKNVRGPYIQQGGKWAGGSASAIDNTILANVFTPKEAHELLWVVAAKKECIRYLREKQLGFGADKKSEKEAEVGADHHSKTVNLKGQARFKAAVEAALRKKLVEEKQASMKSMIQELSERSNMDVTQWAKDQAEPLEDWGMMPQAVKEALWKMAQDRFLDLKPVKPSIFDRFVDFCQKNPGKFFTQAEFAKFAQEDPVAFPGPLDPKLEALTSKQLHWLIQIAGMWGGKEGRAPKLQVLSRETVEGMTPIRHYEMEWTRQFDLKDLDKEGNEFVLVPGNKRETSHVRANQGPYEPFHGMTMADRGFPITVHESSPGASSLDSLQMAFQRLRYNIGVPHVPNMATNEACDIERILVEASMSNTKPTEKARLKGERPLTNGKNSAAGSSIIATPHTQSVSASIQDFPIYNLAPFSKGESKALNATVDLTTVGGEKSDAFYLKLTTNNPPSSAFIKALMDMRMSFLKAFGGNDGIDFHCQAIPNEQGKLVVIYAPHVRFQKSADGTCFNRDIKESNKTLNLAAEHLHLGYAAGHFGVTFFDPKTQARDPRAQAILDNGKESLERQWQFAAKKGARDHMIQYINRHWDVELVGVPPVAVSQSSRAPEMMLSDAGSRTAAHQLPVDNRADDRRASERPAL